MTFEIGLMLTLIVLALVFFVRETFPIEVTALALLATLLVTGLVSPADAFAGFSNKAVLAIAALFVLSHALVRTGVLETLAEELGRRVGSRSWLGIGLLLGLVAVLSGFLNNTAVVAIFIPLTLDLSARFGVSPSKVLIPLSYASIFGGTLTLIGTSTNLLVSSLLEDAGEPPIRMFELTPLGFVLLAIGLVYILLFARRGLPGRAEPGALTGKYRMSSYLTEVRVDADSPLVGRTCRETRLAERYGVSVLAIVGPRERPVDDVANEKLRPDDVLIVQARMDDTVRLAREEGLSLLPEVKLSGDAELEAGGFDLAEVLVAPLSGLIGKTIKDVNFRERYGCFVIAIRRVGVTLRDKIARVRLRFPDCLLVLVPRGGLEELRQREDLMVVSTPPSHLWRGRFWWLVLVLLPVAVLLAALGVMEIAATATVAVVLLLLAGALAPPESYRSINWSVIFLIAAFVPVGSAFLTTGTADFLASGLLWVARAVPPEAAPWASLALVYLGTSLLTQMVSNAAAAIIVTPIAISLAGNLGLDPRPFVVAICFAASAEFMTPMGYQTNLMVYGPGAYRFLDYTRFGGPLNLLFWVLAVALIPRFWPF